MEVCGLCTKHGVRGLSRGQRLLRGRCAKSYLDMPTGVLLPTVRFILQPRRWTKKPFRIMKRLLGLTVSSSRSGHVSSSIFQTCSGQAFAVCNGETEEHPRHF